MCSVVFCFFLFLSAWVADKESHVNFGLNPAMLNPKRTARTKIGLSRRLGPKWLEPKWLRSTKSFYKVTKNIPVVIDKVDSHLLQCHGRRA
jgi:hypothetical protein